MSGDAYSHLPDPMKIYQDHLDALSSALMSRNFSAFARRIHLPHTIISERKRQIVESKDEMADLFYAFHASLKSQKVTEYLRIATRADYKSEDHICGEHMTHIFSGGQRIVAPYPNRVRLELVGAEWCETACSNAVLNTDGPRGFARVSENPVVAPLPDRAANAMENN